MKCRGDISRWKEREGMGDEPWEAGWKCISIWLYAVASLGRSEPQPHRDTRGGLCHRSVEV
jgi:hypothetical protein